MDESLRLAMPHARRLTRSRPLRVNDTLIETTSSEWVILRNARGQWVASMSREVYEAIFDAVHPGAGGVTPLSSPAQLTSRLSRD